MRHLRVWFILSALLTLSASGYAQQLARDVSIKLISPVGYGLPRTPKLQVKVRLSNLGTLKMSNIIASVLIQNEDGQVKLQDMVTIGEILSGDSVDITFDSLVQSSPAFYGVEANIRAEGDQDSTNNRHYRIACVGGGSGDMIAKTVISPQSLDYKQKLGFPLIARFSNLGHRDLVSAPVRLQVRGCEDNSLAFASEGVIPLLSFTANDVDFSFAPSQAGKHLKDLLPGCYNLYAIARFPADGDRMNDTVVLPFTIIPNKLTNDLVADKTSGPADKTNLAVKEAINLPFSFVNAGTNTQASAKASVMIHDRKANLVYRDSVIFANWAPTETRSHNFKPFASDTIGEFYIRAFTSLPNEEAPYDDTVARQVTVGPYYDARIVTISEPIPNSVYRPGIAFTPKVLVEWVGAYSLPKDYSMYFRLINIDTYEEVFYSESKAVGLGIDTPVQIVSFPTSYQKWEIGSVPRGQYRAIAGINSDDNSSNNTDTTYLTFRSLYDVKVDSIGHPRSWTLYPIAPIQVKGYVRNVGESALSEVIATVTIKDRADRLVYFRTLTKSIGVDQTQTFDFPSFTPMIQGGYTIELDAASPLEEGASDPALRTAFYAGTSIYHASIYKAIIPAPDEVIPERERFAPTVELKWEGPWLGDETMISGTVSIYDCDKEILRFQNISWINTVDGLLLEFSPFSDSKNTGQLRPGCYRAVFSISPMSDLDPSDDTLVVPFTIGNPSSVDGQQTAALRLVSVAQLSEAIRVCYTADPNEQITWRVTDIQGHTVNSGRSTANEIAIPCRSLTSGSYVIELRSDESGEAIRRLVNLIR
jgi:hypothetical protein